MGFWALELEKMNWRQAVAKQIKPIRGKSTGEEEDFSCFMSQFWWNSELPFSFQDLSKISLFFSYNLI